MIHIQVVKKSLIVYVFNYHAPDKEVITLKALTQWKKIRNKIIGYY